MISVDPQVFVLELAAPEKIVVINLDRRPERWQAMLDTWQPELAGRFVRFSATDGQLLPEPLVRRYAERRKVPFERAAGELGCRESWFRAVSEHGPGLYFEDDARPCAPWAFGPPPDSPEIVLLGGDLWTKAPEPGWLPPGKGLNGTHATWIRTQRAADELMAVWHADAYRKGPVDFAWTRVLSKVDTVVAVPQIVCQADTGTDVQIGRRRDRNQLALMQPWCSLART